MFRFMYVDCQHGFYSQELPTESGSSRAEQPEELYSCSLCDCACRLIDLKKHLLESHRGAVHFCDKCEFTVTDLTDLEDHKKRMSYLLAALDRKLVSFLCLPNCLQNVFPCPGFC